MAVQKAEAQVVEGIATAAGTPTKANSPTKPKASGNITSHDAGELKWNRDDVEASLEAMRAYALRSAQRSEDWYWAQKASKMWFAVTIQWSAIGLTGTAAVLPIAAKLQLFPAAVAWLHHNMIGPGNAGLFASFLIGIGAAMLGFDRVAGMSSGWTRYVLTATAMRVASEEFRMDWAALYARLATPLQIDQVEAMIQRVKQFRLAIEALVTKETQDWATEFRQNMNSLEADLKVQVDNAKVERAKVEQEAKARADEEKAQADKEKAEREAATRPGSLEARVPNANTTDGFQFQAKLETNTHVSIINEPVNGSETWTHLTVPAGLYKLTISATTKAQKVSSTTVVFVKPDETTKCELSLPSLLPVTSDAPH